MYTQFNLQQTFSSTFPRIVGSWLRTPTVKVADILKELIGRWPALDEVTRSMFEQMADNDKQRFRQEKAEYNMSPKGGYKQTRAKKDPNAPKRPLCGFMTFSNEERVILTFCFNLPSLSWPSGSLTPSS